MTIRKNTWLSSHFQYLRDFNLTPAEQRAAWIKEATTDASAVADQRKAAHNFLMGDLEDQLMAKCQHGDESALTLSSKFEQFYTQAMFQFVDFSNPDHNHFLLAPDFFPEISGADGEKVWLAIEKAYDQGYFKKQLADTDVNMLTPWKVDGRFKGAIFYHKETDEEISQRALDAFSKTSTLVPNVLPLLKIENNMKKHTFGDFPAIALLDENGQKTTSKFCFNFYEQPNILFVGASGSGKTAALRTTLLPFALSPSVRLHIFDFKEGDDGGWRMFKPVAATYQHLENNDDGTTNLKEMFEALQNACQAVQARASKRSAEAAAKEAAGDFSSESDFWDEGPTPENPMDIFILDECQTIFSPEAMSKDDQKIAYKMEAFAVNGTKKYRSFGGSFIFATQRADQASLPHSISSLATLRFVMKINDPLSITNVLGDKRVGNDVDPNFIPSDARGEGVVSENGEWQYLKFYYLTNQQLGPLLAGSDKAKDLAAKRNGQPGQAQSEGEAMTMISNRNKLAAERLKNDAKSATELINETIGGPKETPVIDAVQPHEPTPDERETAMNILTNLSDDDFKL